jgi:hypothetical protein
MAESSLHGRIYGVLVWVMWSRKLSTPLPGRLYVIQMRQPKHR